MTEAKGVAAADAEGVAAAGPTGAAAGDVTDDGRDEAAAEDTREGAVAAAAAALVADFARSDAQAYFAHFAPDATFVFHPTPGRLEDRAAYERLWAQWEREDGFAVRECQSSQVRVQVFGEVAVFSHRVRTRVHTHDGDEVTHERETIVFHERDGRWLAVHEHLSPDPSAEPSDDLGDNVAGDPVEQGSGSEGPGAGDAEPGTGERG